MKTPFVPVLFVLLSVALSGRAADLGQLQTSFMARYDEANATRDQQLKNLEGSYVGALERHLDKIKAGGDLEKVVPVRDEIEAVKTGAEPLPELSANVDREFKSMRGKYVGARDTVRETHARTLVSLSDKMTAALESEEKELTRAGKIDDALAAKRMRETLSKDVGIASARELLGKARAPLALDEPKEWQLLIEQRMKVEEKGMHEVGSLSDVAKEGRGFWNRLLTGGDEQDADEVLVTPSPAKVSFSPKLPATEIRGKVSLAFPNARATVRITAGGKTVFEEELGGRNREARIAVEFEATREIEIEAEQVGAGAAWVYWTAFESR